MNDIYSCNFKRAILHVDGDSFFASCEVARNPSLKNKVVVIGQERGIASAFTNEAKKFGIKRGMPISQVKKMCPGAIFLKGDYSLYYMYSERMYKIIKRYTDKVEKYSIDECFADITGLDIIFNKNYKEIAIEIKNVLYKELGITFSVGLSTTKSLAKLGSKFEKPNGLTIIPPSSHSPYLIKTNVKDVWGIGEKTSILLYKHNIKNAYDFINKDIAYLSTFLSKPYLEIWNELKGNIVYDIKKQRTMKPKSISKTGSFSPVLNNRNYIFSKLSKNIELACIKLRQVGLSSNLVNIFLKTNDFKFLKLSIKIKDGVSNPEEIIKELDLVLNKIYKENILYRATGVTLSNLKNKSETKNDLFNNYTKINKFNDLYKKIDAINIKHGKKSLFLGSSILKGKDKIKIKNNTNKKGFIILGGVK